MISGLAAMPILLAKLWSVMPKLFEWPPVRGAAPRARTALAGPAGRRQRLRLRHRPAQHPGLLSLAVPLPHRPLLRRLRLPRRLRLHIFLKIPVALRTFRERGVLRPLRPGLPRPPSPSPHERVTSRRSSRPGRRSRGGRCWPRSAPPRSAPPSWRSPQTVGGPIRQLGLLLPRQHPAEPRPERLPDQQDAPPGSGSAPSRPAPPGACSWKVPAKRRLLPRAAAGDAPAQLRPADRLRRRLVDDPALDRGAPARPGRAAAG